MSVVLLERADRIVPDAHGELQERMPRHRKMRDVVRPDIPHTYDDNRLRVVSGDTYVELQSSAPSRRVNVAEQSGVRGRNGIRVQSMASASERHRRVKYSAENYTGEQSVGVQRVGVQRVAAQQLIGQAPLLSAAMKVTLFAGAVIAVMSVIFACGLDAALQMGMIR